MKVRVITCGESTPENDKLIPRFLAFSRTVYAASPHWIPQGDDHIEGFLRKETPFCRHCDSRAFLLVDEGRVIARLLAHIDRRSNKHWRQKVGHILFFEALPNIHDKIFALFEASFQWLYWKKMSVVRLSYLHGRQLPLTIDGYDARPTVFHSCNPAYYHNYVKIAGFRSDRGFSEHRLGLTSNNLAIYNKNVLRAEQKGVHFRPFKFSRWKKDSRLIREIHNISFRDHWGAVQLDNKEVELLTDGVRDMIEPSFVVFAEKDKETFAFMYGLPDFNQAYQFMGGRSPKEDPDLFQRCLKNVNHGLLLIGGVKPSHQDLGVGQAMGSKILLAMAAKGYVSASPTLILDTNDAARKYMERLGSKPYRNYITYQKVL